MKKTLHLTHGAMTLALTGIILFADRITLGFFMPFLALPLIIYGAHYSLKESAVVALSNVFLAIILSGMLPTVITSIGYSFVGLSYIYCYHQKASRFEFYVWMSVTMSLFYIVMIAFFSEYFGINLVETVQVVKEMASYLPERTIQFIAYLSVFFTILMEVFIVKVSADMLIVVMKRSGYQKMK